MCKTKLSRRLHKVCQITSSSMILNIYQHSGKILNRVKKFLKWIYRYATETHKYKIKNIPGYIVSCDSLQIRLIVMNDDFILAKYSWLSGRNYESWKNT